MPKLKERWIDELMVTMGIVNCIDDLGCHAISSKLGCHRKVRAERVRKGTYEKGGIVWGETELIENDRKEDCALYYLQCLEKLNRLRTKTQQQPKTFLILLFDMCKLNWSLNEIMLSQWQSVSIPFVQTDCPWLTFSDTIFFHQYVRTYTLYLYNPAVKLERNCIMYLHMRPPNVTDWSLGNWKWIW